MLPGQPASRIPHSMFETKQSGGSDGFHASFKGAAVAPRNPRSATRSGQVFFCAGWKNHVTDNRFLRKVHSRYMIDCGAFPAGCFGDLQTHIVARTPNSYFELRDKLRMMSPDAPSGYVLRPLRVRSRPQAYPWSHSLVV